MKYKNVTNKIIRNLFYHESCLNICFSQHNIYINDDCVKEFLKNKYYVVIKNSRSISKLKIIIIYL